MTSMAAARLTALQSVRLICSQELSRSRISARAVMAACSSRVNFLGWSGVGVAGAAGTGLLVPVVKVAGHMFVLGALAVLVWGGDEGVGFGPADILPVAGA